MTTPPLVSVVVPAYDAERTLAATLQSVLAQTVRDIEVIVVDDGSHDRTAQVAAAIEDPRVRVIQQSNAGVAAARNAGLAVAKGDYVAFLDSDDLWLPNKLERQLPVFEQRPEVKAVQSGVYYVDDELRILSIRRCVPWGDPLLDTLLFKNLPAFPSTVVFTRQALQSLGGFDPSLAILEDWNLAVQAAASCNLESIEEPLALYRVHPGNRSQDLQMHVEPGHRVLQRIFSDPALPERVRRHEDRVYGRFYTMLAGGSLRNRQWRQAADWGHRAMRKDPRSAVYMMALPVRRVQRRLSRRDAAAHRRVAEVWSGK